MSSFRQRHPGLAFGSRRLRSQLLGLNVRGGVDELEAGVLIEGPFELDDDGPSVGFLCDGRVYICHCDEFADAAGFAVESDDG